MTQSNPQGARIDITLRENGLHSLWRGLELYKYYSQSNDKMMLKDAVMFVHHGIELLMKQILVKHDQYLIFEDMRAVVQKQREADRLGVGIFYLENPPKTITCEEAIKRVEVLIKPEGLDENLAGNLIKLIRIRNQLEHYAISAEREPIEQLLSAILDPLVDMFERELGGIKRNQPPVLRDIRDVLQSAIKENEQRKQEVHDAIMKFAGQHMPGHLLNTEGEIVLPSFKECLANYRVRIAHGRSFMIDLLCSDGNTKWAIAIKLRGGTLQEFDYVISTIQAAITQLPATLWLILFADIPSELKDYAKRHNIMISGTADWEELKERIYQS